jgi:hypothetical protein
MRSVVAWNKRRKQVAGKMDLPHLEAHKGGAEVIASTSHWSLISLVVLKHQYHRKGRCKEGQPNIDFEIEKYLGRDDTPHVAVHSSYTKRSPSI